MCELKKEIITSAGEELLSLNESKDKCLIDLFVIHPELINVDDDMRMLSDDSKKILRCLHGKFNQIYKYNSQLYYRVAKYRAAIIEYMDTQAENVLKENIAKSLQDSLNSFKENNKNIVSYSPHDKKKQTSRNNNPKRKTHKKAKNKKKSNRGGYKKELQQTPSSSSSHTFTNMDSASIRTGLFKKEVKSIFSDPCYILPGKDNEKSSKKQQTSSNEHKSKQRYREFMEWSVRHPYTGGFTK